MISFISGNDKKLKYSSFYNIYPYRNEVSQYALNSSCLSFGSNDLVLDDGYGRVFTKDVYENACPYGQTIRMQKYDDGIKNGQVMDYLRVPYRKVPIYKVNDNNEAESIIHKIQLHSSSHKILIRGQNVIYPYFRSDDEKECLFGEANSIEPSFLSSHNRMEIDEHFLNCMWNSHATILLNDVGCELKEALPIDKFHEYWESANFIKNGYLSTPFSLGMAQHYGLPSVGLDLTSDYNTALWFATNTLKRDKTGLMRMEPVNDLYESTIFVFRCPINSVFSFKAVRPKHFPNSRPDMQNAWFGHVGWGYSRNQMASYLACGIRVTPKMAKQLRVDFGRYLFPKESDDQILRHYMRIKNLNRYEGNAKMVIDKVYDVA